MTSVKNIAIIGSGNVANYLAVKLFSSHFNISQIISRNSLTGNQLAKKVKAECTSEYELNPDIDLVFICVPDHQINDCADRLGSTNALVCHCAGSIDMTVLDKFKNHGVFYPLQSLSSEYVYPEMEVPFLIEANNQSGLDQLIFCLNKIDQKHVIVNSKIRLHYHLAAVFANNFTNAMLVATEGLVEKYQLELSILKPLIRQTFEKTINHLALETQTGPAKRNDLETIQKHLELLKEEPELFSIYTIMTEYISKKYNS